MAAVNEWVVREYFEQHGFLVSQPRKYTVPGRQKQAEEEVDLVVHNPATKIHKVPDHVVWTTEDLRTISRAVIGVRGWHTDRFYVSTLEQTPEILGFVEQKSMEFASKILGDTSVARVLCLPRLPASGDLKLKATDMLRQKGVDGIISFETMLADLIRGVDRNRNYEKSDLLQILRILKCYDLLKDAQMDLFTGKRRTKARSS